MRAVGQVFISLWVASLCDEISNNSNQGFSSLESFASADYLEDRDLRGHGFGGGLFGAPLMFASMPPPIVGVARPAPVIQVVPAPPPIPAPIAITPAVNYDPGRSSMNQFDNSFVAPPTASVDSSGYDFYGAPRAEFPFQSSRPLVPLTPINSLTGMFQRSGRSSVPVSNGPAPTTSINNDIDFYGMSHRSSGIFQRLRAAAPRTFDRSSASVSTSTNSFRTEAPRVSSGRQVTMDMPPAADGSFERRVMEVNSRTGVMTLVSVEIMQNSRTTGASDSTTAYASSAGGPLWPRRGGGGGGRTHSVDIRDANGNLIEQRLYQMGLDGSMSLLQLLVYTAPIGGDPGTWSPTRPFGDDQAASAVPAAAPTSNLPPPVSSTDVIVTPPTSSSTSSTNGGGYTIVTPPTSTSTPTVTQPNVSAGYNPLFPRRL